MLICLCGYAHEQPALDLRPPCPLLAVGRRCQEVFLQRRHGLTALSAWCAVHQVIQTAYAYAIRWWCRPWLQCDARCWN